MEFRKHYLDFTSSEKAELYKYLKEDDYKITKHTSIRQKEKIITEKEIHRAIHNGKIIEYHYKDSNRILVRGNTNEKGYNICVVLDVNTKEVITAFDNKVTDNHYTLDTSKYISYINILNLLSNKNTYSN